MRCTPSVGIVCGVVKNKIVAASVVLSVLTATVAITVARAELVSAAALVFVEVLVVTGGFVVLFKARKQALLVTVLATVIMCLVFAALAVLP